MYNILKRFFVARVNGFCFCPETAERFDAATNVTMYITNDSDFQHGVVNPRTCALRVAGNKLGPDGGDISAAVGRQIQRVEGVELVKQAYFGPEASVYTNSLIAGKSFVPDLRELFGRLYDSEDILKKLGIHQQVPGIRNEGGGNAPPLFCESQFRHGDSLQSVAQGVHAMAAIACVALAGEISYHPFVTANMARNAVGMILKEFPAVFTPNNSTKLINFDPKTVVPRNIRVDVTDRPAYLPRPQNDHLFFSSGVFTLGPVIMTKFPRDTIEDDVVFGLLPEHCAHNDGLIRWASLLKCDVMEVPIEKIEVILCFVFTVLVFGACLTL